MGIINLSPESFYKGSVYKNRESIEKRCNELLDQKADFVDIGARSTAPGVRPISKAEEKKRLIPAVEIVKDLVDIPLSVDTQFSELADIALSKGADIINDVSGFKKDNKMVDVAKDYICPVVVMATKKVAGDCLSLVETLSELQESINIAQKKDIDNLILDPAIGRWVSRRNYVNDVSILRNLAKFREFQKPILIALSRKSFLSEILEVKTAYERLEGSLAATAIGVYNGAHIVRTHDILQTKQAIKVAEAILNA